VRFLTRLLQRLLILGLGIFSVWLIVFVVFKFADRRLPWILALGLTYGVAAYVILPRAVRMGLKVLQRKSVPQFTITGDGLPGDPVNLVLMGTLQQLRAAFAAAGWSEADPLGLASSWRMIRAFVFNSPYPTAPFSTLYLFGRGQDIGFQKAIDDSPRKRHHIRFWSLSLEHAEGTVGTASFWMNTDRPPDHARVLWIGAGTRDTGFSLTQLTFQVTRFRYQCRTRLYRRGIEKTSSHHGNKNVSVRRIPEHGTRQPLYCRWGGHGGGPRGGDLEQFPITLTLLVSSPGLTGRSSTRGQCLLDRPVKPGDDSELCVPT